MPVVYHFKDLKTSPTVDAKMQQVTCQSASWRGRLFPSGRISVGRIPKKKISKTDHEYEATRTKSVYFERQRWDYQEGLVKEIRVRDYPPSTLGSSSVPICHKASRPRYGSLGISRSGRTKVLELATCLKQRYGRRLGFYTITCPYQEPEAIEAFNTRFNEIMRKFFQELKREYHRNDTEFVYTAVYEIQTRRFNQTGEIALHAHWVAPCYIPGTFRFVISADRIRNIYRRVCQKTLLRETEFNASVDAQVVKKDASAYLAKYLSKGDESISSIPDDKILQLPRRWWSSNRMLRNALKRATIELSQELCEELIYTPASTVFLSSLLYYRKDIYIHWAGQDLRVGVAVCAKPPLADFLRPPDYFHNLYYDLPLST